MVMKRPYCTFGYACSLGLVFLSSTNLFGQEKSNKQVTEPVFRVPKVVNQQQTPVESVQEQENQSAVQSGTAPVEKVARAIDFSALPPTNRASSDIVSGVNAANSATPPVRLASTLPAAATTAAPHPLDNALEIAHTGLARMQSSIHDYTATLVKRELVNGRVGDQEFMKIKVRNARSVNGKQSPFSVYMKFLKPVAGREVLYVDGKNNGNLLAYEPGTLTGFKTFALDPDGWMAMKGNRHPIYEAGLENLVCQLIEKAERDKAAGHCEVEYRQGAKINGRSCLMIQVTHPVRQAPYDFYQAQVFIDDELQVPIRYAAYDWPTAPGQAPTLLEEYTYLKIELNVGLTDADFDPANTEYKFPGY